MRRASRRLAESHARVRFSRGGVDGHIHIVAGVPVGDRKYIQIVDRLTVGVQIRRAALDHIGKHRAVYRCYHISSLSFPSVSRTTCSMIRCAASVRVFSDCRLTIRRASAGSEVSRCAFLTASLIVLPVIDISLRE